MAECRHSWLLGLECERSANRSAMGMGMGDWGISASGIMEMEVRRLDIFILTSYCRHKLDILIYYVEASCSTWPQLGTSMGHAEVGGAGT